MLDEDGRNNGSIVNVSIIILVLLGLCMLLIGVRFWYKNRKLEDRMKAYDLSDELELPQTLPPKAVIRRIQGGVNKSKMGGGIKVLVSGASNSGT